MTSMIRWVYGCIKPFKWAYMLTIFFVVLETASGTGLIAIQKWIIDDVAINGQYDKLLPILIGYGAIILVFAAMFTLTPYYMQKNEGKLRINLSCTTLKNLYRMPMKQLNETRTGHIYQVINSEIQQLSELIAFHLPRGIQHLSNIIFIGIILGFIDVRYLVFVLGISIVYVLIGKFFVPKLGLIAKDVVEKRSDIVVTLEESVSSTREIISFGREEWEKERNYGKFLKYFNEVMRELKWSNSYQTIGEILKWVCNIALLSIGGYFVMNGASTIGLLVISYQLVSQLVTSMHDMSQFLASLVRLTTLRKRIEELSKTPQLKEGELNLATVKSINLHNINFEYIENNPVLKGVNLDIPIGKKIAFVGSSGSGKSTLGHLLMNFFEPKKGEVRINGQHIEEYSQLDLLSKIGIVFQDPYIFADTIIGNITLMEYKDDVREEVMRIADLAGLRELINKLPDGLDTKIGERGLNLSGGERQRLAIARALWMNKEVLIMDEATSALDVTTEKYVMEALKRYREGKTTIMIAHRLSTVEDSDLIIVIEDGRIVETGKHNDLMSKKSVYHKLSNTVFV